MITQHVPGMSVAIIAGGRPPVVRSYGYADLESCVPATSDTLFGIGSLSKQFTAVGALLLVSEGRLALEDPVVRYLPEGKGIWDDVRIRNLLTHTSGIPDYAQDDAKYPSIPLDRTTNPATTELLKLIARAPLNFRPGEDWAYSNTGFLLLSVIIERVSGVPFPSFMHDRVFAPLGMTSTRYYSALELIPHRGTPYHQDQDGIVSHGPYISDQFSHWGDTGMLSTALDMSRWVSALGRDRILPASLWAAMFAPVQLNDGTRSPYGFGIQLDEVADQPLWAHSGTFRVGYSAMLLKFPQRGLAVVDLGNSYGPGFAMPDIATKIAGSEAPELAPASMRAARPDPEPGLTAGLLNLLQGKDPAHGAAAMTDRFRLHDSLHKAAADALGDIPSDALKLQYLGCMPAQKEAAPAALGVAVNRQCAYRFNGIPAPGISVWLTTDNKVAGLSTW